jgi:hypothetical protein
MCVYILYIGDKAILVRSKQEQSTSGILSLTVFVVQVNGKSTKKDPEKRPAVIVRCGASETIQRLQQYGL